MINPLRRSLRRLVRPRSPRQRRIEALVGEPVRDWSVYQQALRHHSVDRDKPGGRLRSNERLEFLGDAVLGLIVAEHLYETFPSEMEGYLSQLRSKLVNEGALSAAARSLGLGREIQLSAATARQGGRESDRILADAMEALIGALFLDLGLRAAQRFILYALIEETDLDRLSARTDNHKAALQQLAQGRGWPTPKYKTIHSSGPPHNRMFQVAVSVGTLAHATAHGRSKKKAEQKAAKTAIAVLNRLDESADATDDA